MHLEKRADTVARTNDRAARCRGSSVTFGKMTRSYKIVWCGAALVVSGYFGFPVFFQYVERASAPKHIDVSTAKVAAIHIGTSDPKTSLLVFEADGVVSVAVTKMGPDGDYVHGLVNV